jgi:hypothetical protein
LHNPKWKLVDLVHLYQLIVTTSHNTELFIWMSKCQVIHSTNMGINLHQERNVNQTAITTSVTFTRVTHLHTLGKLI